MEDCRDCKMSKVFVVTQGSYSAYHIEAVFADEAVANEYASHLHDGTVEEWELGKWTKAQGVYIFDFALDGTIVEEHYTPNMDPVPETEEASEWMQDGHAINIRVNRGDRDLAVKIASERYTRVRASLDEARALVERADIKELGSSRPHLEIMVAKVLAGTSTLPNIPPSERSSFHNWAVRALEQSA